MKCSALGKQLLILPDNMDDRPSREFSEWHKEKVYV
jgi:hypothetical protein